MATRFEYFYFDNGAVREVRPYVNETLHGVLRRWHPNGLLALEMPYLNGKRHGQVKTWNQNGKLDGFVTWINGKVLGRTQAFDADGVVSHSWYFLEDGEVTLNTYAKACLMRPDLPRYKEVADLLTKVDSKSMQEFIDPKITSNKTRSEAGDVDVIKEPFLPDPFFQYLLGKHSTEALSWLEDATPGSSRNLGELARIESIEFVRRLYNIGASAVFAVDIVDDKEYNSQTTNYVVVQLPSVARYRALLFECEQEVNSIRGLSPTPDHGQEHILFYIK